jgi:hypothetical protein
MTLDKAESRGLGSRLGGLAMRFPRICAHSLGKPAVEANRIETLEVLLRD